MRMQDKRTLPRIKTSLLWWIVDFSVPTLLTVLLYSPVLLFLAILGAQPKAFGFFIVALIGFVLWLILFLVWSVIQYLFTVFLQKDQDIR